MEDMNVNLIVNPKEIEEFILLIDDKISQLSEYGHSVERLTYPQKIFFFNQNFEREMNNGGIDQFFFNSSGKFAHETVNALTVIGAIKTAKLLQDAINIFPNALVPKNREERIKLMNEIAQESSSLWENIDERFYEYQENLSYLNFSFIGQHPNDF